MMRIKTRLGVGVAVATITLGVGAGIAAATTNGGPATPAGATQRTAPAESTSRSGWMYSMHEQMVGRLRANDRTWFNQMYSEMGSRGMMSGYGANGNASVGGMMGDLTR